MHIMLEKQHQMLKECLLCRHKSHSKKNLNTCQMSEHLITYHKGEDAQKFVTIQILQECPNEEVALKAELWWQRRLFSFKPTGLNVRQEIPK